LERAIGTIDKMVKEKFLTIYNAALEKASVAFEKEIQAALDKSSPYDKIKFLNEKRAELKAQADNIQITPYLKNANNEDWLMKLFASRFTILNVDDTTELDRAVYLGALQGKINEAYLYCKNEIPEYSFDSFIKGIDNPILFELNYIYHINDSNDFFKIRHWQVEQLVKVISFETTNIINNILSQLREFPEYKEKLERDVNLYDNTLSKSTFTQANELMGLLENFSFMKDYPFNLISISSILADHEQFKQGEPPWSQISPKSIDASRQRFNKIKQTPFSDTPFIFYTIYQTINWAKAYLDGQEITDKFNYPNYIEVAKKTIADAETEADKIIEAFEQTIDHKIKSKQETEQICRRELELLRHKFNCSEDTIKEYFASLQKEDNTPNIFQMNAFFFDMDQHIHFLKEACILRELIHYFIISCRELGGNNRVEYPGLDDGSSISEIMYLAHNMVLDSDLHDKLSDILDDFMRYTMAYNMPMDIALQNVREAMHQLFIECIDRLLNYLEDAHPASKVMYIQTRLKQLKQRELGFKQLVSSDENNMQAKYTSLLREYLELEAEFIQETKDISFLQQPIKIIQPSKPKKQQSLLDAPLSFKFKASKDALRKFITELNAQIYLLSGDIDAVEDLVTLLTSDNLLEEQSKITFNCETTQLYYIFNKLKPYFLDLSFKNIEKSQLFFTKNGNLLKAQNLSASKVDYPKNYKEIDRAFTHLQ
jgi:hypothetical protein